MRMHNLRMNAHV